MSLRSRQTKHVIIHFHMHHISGSKGMLICLPVDNLIFKEETPGRKFAIMLPRVENEHRDIDSVMSCICTNTSSHGGPFLYLFGGINVSPGVRDFHCERVAKKVYRFNIPKLPGEVISIERCDDMIFGAALPLLAHIDDSIYVFCDGKTKDDDVFKPAFQWYNITKNTWTIFDSDRFVDMIYKCDYDTDARWVLGSAPHVVIGDKLHVSVGNSALTFDTDGGAWEDCKLYKHFWSKQSKKKSGLPPVDIYGREVRCEEAAKKMTETMRMRMKRKRSRKNNRGFGFFGRGIVWDNNILLGLRYAINCPLVAFLLDDKSRRVVRSQRISLENLLPRSELSKGACLVDLGESGFFGLVHTLPDYENYDEENDCGPVAFIQLVILRVEKVGATTSGTNCNDDDDFLKCKIVHKEIVADGLSPSIGSFINAFCVSHL